MRGRILVLILCTGAWAAGLRIDLLQDQITYNVTRKDRPVKGRGQFAGSVILDGEKWKIGARWIHDELILRDGGEVKTNVLINVDFDGQIPRGKTCDELRNFCGFVVGSDGRYAYSLGIVFDSNVDTNVPPAAAYGCISPCAVPIDVGPMEMILWWLYVVRKGYDPGVPLEQFPTPRFNPDAQVLAHVTRHEITWSERPPYTPSVIWSYYDPDRMEQAWKSIFLAHFDKWVWERITEYEKAAEKIRSIPYPVPVSCVRVTSWTNTPLGTLPASYRVELYIYATLQYLFYEWVPEQAGYRPRDLSKPLPLIPGLVEEGRVIRIEPCELKHPLPLLDPERRFWIADYRFKDFARKVSMVNYGYLTFWPTSRVQALKYWQQHKDTMFFAEIPFYQPPKEWKREVLAVLLLVIFVSPVFIIVYRKMRYRHYS